MDDKKKLYIRSSVAEFLIFSNQSGKDNIEVRFENETLWMTQKMIGMLFDVAKSTLSEHFKNIFEENEIEKDLTVRKFRTVQIENEREVKRNIQYYNLDAIISVGYRVNSKKATQFRKWATAILKKYAVEGYVIDKKRMEDGVFLGKVYFENLLEEVREIRISERRFYQKLTDIYATSMDYDANAKITKLFFSKIQNKMHYAVASHTAPEIVYNRVNSSKDHMGLTNWKNSPDGKILKSDAIIAKNYLSKKELNDLSRIVNAFLELAEARAEKRIPMTMKDWSTQIDRFLFADDREILKDAGKISMSIAKNKVDTEFEKYRIIQDRLFESDFDRLFNQVKQ